MTIPLLDVALAGARLAEPLLRSFLLASCYGSRPLQPVARLMTLEQWWAEEGYATFTTGNAPSSTTEVLGASAFIEEVQCSQRLS